VLSGSLKEPLGGLMNGGGKGRGTRLAKSASPVSKRKGRRREELVRDGATALDAVDAEDDEEERWWSSCHRRAECEKRTLELGPGVEMLDANKGRDDLLIPMTRPLET
jgi:hypothetical protein